MLEYIDSCNPSPTKNLMKQMWRKSVGVKCDGNDGDEICGKMTNSVIGCLLYE